MAATVNRAEVIGFLGKDPEVRYLSNGDAVATVSVATTEKWKDKQSGEQKEATEWHRCVCYGKTAELAGEYLKKGAYVRMVGKLKTRKWTDKDGNERYTTEIAVNEMSFLDRRQDSDSPREAPVRSGTRPAERPQRETPRSGQRQPAGGSGFDDMDDDIPF